MPRFRVRTLMIAVAVVAVLMALVGPLRKGYRCWRYYQSQASLYARFEKQERARAEKEAALSIDRGGMEEELSRTLNLDTMPEKEREQRLGQLAQYHRDYAEQSARAARRWKEQREESEMAALWGWDPFMPDVPH